MANFARGFILVGLAALLAGCGNDKSPISAQTLDVLTRARDDKRVADIKQVQTSLELYYFDKNSYPAGSAVTLGGASAQTLSSAGFTDTSLATGAIYMARIPQNPTPGGVPYAYTQVDGGDSYAIEFFLEGWDNGCDLLSGLLIASPSGINLPSM